MKNYLLTEANAVYEYLLKNDIGAQRLTFKGFGASKPIADNKTEIGRKKQPQNFVCDYEEVKLPLTNLSF